MTNKTPGLIVGMMNWRSARFAVLFISLLSIVIIGCKKEEAIPVPEQDYRFNTNLFLPNENGDSVHIGDPHVLKVEDTYYLYGTGYSSAGLAAWSSTDLHNWKFEGLVWRPTPGSWNTVKLWAPDVVQGDDGFYMYYTANTRIGIAYSSSPVGPFIDVYDHPFVGGGYGGVGDGVYYSDNGDDIENHPNYAIDAHVFKASDGSLTFYSTTMAPLGMMQIASWPMKDYRTLASETPTIALDVDPLSWEFFVREAAWILEKDGVFHLVYSGFGTFDHRYAVGVATANNPLGPFVRRPDNPILSTKAVKGIFGPGHCSVVEGKYGDWLIFYHSRDQMGADARGPRKTRYLPLNFDAQGNIRIQIP